MFARRMTFIGEEVGIYSEVRTEVAGREMEQDVVDHRFGEF